MAIAEGSSENQPAAVETLPQATSWKALLAAPGDSAHIVQIYEDPDFLAEAVSHFAAEGIARGEAVILVPTGLHWKKISACLASKGIDPQARVLQGQLTVLDADDIMPTVMDTNMPSESVFKSLAGSAIEKARGGGKYTRVRWWGEIVNTLYAQGNLRASARMEELCTEVAHAHATPIFCSFLMDKFDPCIYDGAFGTVCRTHSHMIPADDYVLHRLSINHAISNVMGEMDGALLRSLTAWKGVSCRMPSSQALLVWVRETMPDQFPAVLASAQAYETSMSHVEGVARRSAS